MAQRRNTGYNGEFIQPAQTDEEWHANAAKKRAAAEKQRNEVLASVYEGHAKQVEVVRASCGPARATIRRVPAVSGGK